MITEATAVALRQNLGDMLNRVQYRRDSIVITKDGKPVAALVDAALFERIRAMQDRFDALCDRIAKGYEGIPEEQGLAEIDAAVSAVRKEMKAEAAAAKGRAAKRTTPATSSSPAKPTAARKTGATRKRAR
ncbi:MAG TPA: type II toxin-antitoxin system Phd/YefM family antitoxin [Rubrivivax sp.]|nr:type II toxin-antitoxin system Phd/YefM family antitoxin [Rubrivivax sp.]